MTAPQSRKNRILTLIIDNVFGTITKEDESELSELLNHPDEDRKGWELLMDREKLMDFISTNFNDGAPSDLAAAKEKFDKLTGKK
ncbi:MAG: hypothetical protein ABI675_02760 [Chitinophagaceae bacterium]